MQVNKKIAVGIGVLTLLSLSTEIFAFSCYRHIYNESESAWTFSAPGGSSQAGDVYFLNTDCPKDGPCTIPAGESVKIKYTTTDGWSQGDMTVTDKTGHQKVFYYSGHYGNCPGIDHSGSTGAVSLNQPANGDWKAWGNTWDNPQADSWSEIAFNKTQ
ncbi:hypothetical protein PsalMR5_03224 [Piscirickettsia salmonis]|uniref:hypothetical protein n=1 Tax=Piscirickettsia salmonis TaxID=1238 RepID=UPI0012BAD2AC|nr:hypothetical protein [Piscirickettsia salmonis]QGP55765.1 hypothetical protein PsalSR1_03219 [Piscirickettsia salmonis]QGP58372.1 hypothetical protein PsalBI1_00943 [Piscirickettsia salmonis]QGP65334.1 hypothetical protein PsalMR5_03224 [Piscirickettsia salmonis]